MHRERKPENLSQSPNLLNRTSQQTFQAEREIDVRACGRSCGGNFSSRDVVATDDPCNTEVLQGVDVDNVLAFETHRLNSGNAVFLQDVFQIRCTNSGCVCRPNAASRKACRSRPVNFLTDCQLE